MRFIIVTMFIWINFMNALETAPFLSVQEIDNIANDALQKFNVPGASISIVFNDQVLSRGYGFRDLDKKNPVTEQTLFRIGSCTKAFTAALLVQLVDAGKLTLDDPIQKYIPEFFLGDQERTAQITIRDLLAHRTGLARHDPIWFFSEFQRPSVLELLKKLEPACDLRQEFQYNNFMYTVAGIIAERLTGLSWEELLSSQLFKPLEMKNSTASLEELQASSDFSLPYAEINANITPVPFRNISSMNPGGGIISNAVDMANWLKLQFSHDAQKPTLQEMHRIHMPFSSIPSETEKVVQLGYGLGWFIGKYRGYDFISHGGDLDGFSSEVAFLPEKGIGIVILTNSSSDGRYVVASIRNQIIDKMLGIEDTDWMNTSQELHIYTKNALHKTLEQFASRQTPSIQSLEAYVGCYVHPAYGRVELKIENNHLLAIFGKITIPLYYKFDNVFTGQFSELLIYGINPLIDITFFKDSSDTVHKIEIPFEGFRAAKPITFIRYADL